MLTRVAKQKRNTYNSRLTRAAYYSKVGHCCFLKLTPVYPSCLHAKFPHGTRVNIAITRTTGRLNRFCVGTEMVPVTCCLVMHSKYVVIESKIPLNSHRQFIRIRTIIFSRYWIDIVSLFQFLSSYEILIHVNIFNTLLIENLNLWIIKKTVMLPIDARARSGVVA